MKEDNNLSSRGDFLPTEFLQSFVHHGALTSRHAGMKLMGAGKYPVASAPISDFYMESLLMSQVLRSQW